MKKLILFALLGATVGNAWSIDLENQFATISGNNLTLPHGSGVIFSSSDRQSRSFISNHSDWPVTVSFIETDGIKQDGPFYRLNAQAKIAAYTIHNPSNQEHQPENAPNVFYPKHEVDYNITRAGLSVAIDSSPYSRLISEINR